ncbi:hypothetical protein SLS59_006057 [Nothophoma quercina]|uniref:GmrSD restriction endonucleases N-terminal domain-containing protein n=1 Tax=Nothophoma quercina TaxID=749835 RepID=A0ABR3R789_9PLEO
MEPSQASARPSRSTTRSNCDEAAAAGQLIVKKEDINDGDDDDDDAAVYRSRPQLQEPVVLMRNLADLMKLMDAGVIDVDPEYQREVVWTADRMTGLINSLMENFYIPPIILNKKPQASGNATAPKERLVCVDGKQRLSSVMAFIKGLIPCHDHRGEKWWFCEPTGNHKRKRILSEQLQRQFFKKNFVSFEYNNLSPDQEEDLFARVQMGVQLNLAEKMRASTGPWQELAKLFVEDFPDVYALMKDRARSKDFQLTLSCFSQIVECMHPTAANGVPILKTNHTHLPKLLSNKGAVDDGLKSHLASVWNTFKDLIEADPDTFTNSNKYLRGVQTLAPVEMVAITVLISMHSETRNNRLLLGDIQAMRTEVREHFVDLRLNTAVWKWFWEYIDNLEAIRGAIDGSTVNRKSKQRTKKNATSTDNAAAGSTAANITAAAAAPRKDFGQGIHQPRAPTAPMLATTGSFMPDPNYSQMGGSMGLVESATRAAPLRSVPPTARSVPKPRTSLPPTVQTADEGPIDLTSDTEQERQVLLSAFKTKPATTEPPKVSKPTATPTASRRTSTAKQPRVSSQDLPTRENNPYAKFKNK